MVGAFALLPYLALRHPQPTFTGPMDRILSGFDSRWMGLALSILALTLLGYGILQGNWPDFVIQWKSSRLIHVMALDFCLLSTLFPSLLHDDFARRGVHQPALFWAISLLPPNPLVPVQSLRCSHCCKRHNVLHNSKTS